ncbi:DNA polymerase subunit gamma-2, mitochondrial [Habropoda laboriosa]|uniref:DNA polymerase subunit gamma-2, mitochondrial n=1 Tax=Habropoda laboriosa TaxID=597456 RepID=A0A0L7QRI6_9HYME|nr:PREDICTED: DNA polymerase subunit gamma-2, mitochondrial [Habropoda laboriosa]KOC61237.1 DNA polymerase subunit gamma-2, mitochondrial [Habropoda laboriosa]
MTIVHILKELSEHFISFTEHGFMYGPQGKMLLRNLEEHWFLHCITMSRYNIFLSDEFNNTIDFITKTGMSNIPFGLATIKKSKHSWNQSVSVIQKLNYHKTAEIAIFNNNIETEDLFHKIQKERKIWWRRLAQCPSRFKLTEAKKIKSLDTVDIKAQFSFGSITVERITCHTDVQKLFSQVDSKKDFAHIQMVEHMMSLDWGTLALLSDAHDTNKSTKMHIHSMLAPHKVAFHIKRSNNEVNAQSDDLNRFVLYLNNMLRTKGLNTLLTTSEQIIDTCLVPFIVLVDTTSLENGIVHVRDRSTTLSEAVHITDLVKYLIMRC